MANGASVDGGQVDKGSIKPLIPIDPLSLPPVDPPFRPSLPSLQSPVDGGTADRPQSKRLRRNAASLAVRDTVRPPKKPGGGG